MYMFSNRYQLYNLIRAYSLRNNVSMIKQRHNFLIKYDHFKACDGRLKYFERTFANKTAKHGLVNGCLLSVAFFKLDSNNSNFLNTQSEVKLSTESASVIKRCIQFLLCIWEFFCSLFRVTQLSLIFIPLAMLYPLTFVITSFKHYWYKLLLFDLELSGPVFIKLGQWASTRLDLFPEEMCFYLSKLQRKTKPHSWSYTLKVLEESFGNQWRNIFIKFDSENPIGSGCCAQVYKAWIRPETLDGPYIFKKIYCSDSDIRDDNLISVAIKVRHPNMENLLRRDLFIMKSAAELLTSLIPSLKWLSLPDCVDDFSHMMQAQVDFCVEAENLEKFALNFKNIPNVKFPCPILHLTKPHILVETFEDGEPIQKFLTSRKIRQHDLHKKLAALGVNTILKMIFEDNFTHGDLHPGNILVQKCTKSNSKPFSLFSFHTQSPAPLSDVTLVVLDCGIVASLDERGKRCLRDVFYAVSENDGEKVAELFLENSEHQCKDTEKFKTCMKQIVDAAMSKSVTLQQVDVSSLLQLLFSTMIEHKVRLDGSFSSIMLAIIVLKGLGRSLDPTIDLVEKAKPFLLNVL